MLSIRQLFFLLSILYVGLLLSSLLIARLIWFYPTEISLQLERQQQELNSVNSVLLLLQEQLVLHAKNHAKWVASLEAYPSHAQPQDIFYLLSTDADIGMVIDADKQALIAVRRIPNKLEAITDEPEFKQEYSKLITQMTYLTNKVQSDYLQILDKPYLLASSPIMVEGFDQPTGWIILLTELDQSLWSALENISQLKIKAFTPDNYASKPLALNQPLSQIQHQHQRCLISQAGHPVVCLNITHAHSQEPQFLNQQSKIMFAFIIFVPLILFSIFLSVLLNPLYKGINILKESGEKNILKPINFDYWLPVKELKDFKRNYNAIVRMALRQQQQLELISNTDKLTGIPNRRAFDQHFNNTWNRLKRHSMSVALVMIDIDFFKPYNDFYGHQQGDKALQLVATALASLARRTDEMCARFGGEEFTLVVFIENDYELEQFKQRLNTAIQQLKIEHVKSTISSFLTVSAGIAWLQSSGSWTENYLLEDWLKIADEALYRAKSNGRNTQEVTIINEQQPFN